MARPLLSHGPMSAPARVLPATLLLFAACHGDPGPVGTPDAVGARIAASLADVADLDPDVVVLAHEILQPASATLRGTVDVDTCQAVEDRLWTLCGDGLGAADCAVQATFYWAHDIPRCSARLQLDEPSEDAFSHLYAIDFAGPSRANPRERCGDGVLDEAAGEQCDDGNLEPFDGCDPDCQPEPFTGCETVIQQEFSAAGIAWIDAATWRSPRAHLMTHAAADGFETVDAALCDRARTTAQAVCARLSTEMPFVASCWHEVHLTAPTTCDVRLAVQFLTPAPASGVFTTALEGILSFEIAQ
ncbi:MAG: hypothetical protein KC464_18790 [Myxococcales bacterium]|nr:hypothetical protein [Myxococcales bacterium]